MIDLRSALESLFEQFELIDIIDTMIDICFDKAAHIKIYEPDKRQAPLWRRVAKALQQAKTKIIIFTKD